MRYPSWILGPITLFCYPQNQFHPPQVAFISLHDLHQATRSPISSLRSTACNPLHLHRARPRFLCITSLRQSCRHRIRINSSKSDLLQALSQVEKLLLQQSQVTQNHRQHEEFSPSKLGRPKCWDLANLVQGWLPAVRSVMRYRHCYRLAPLTLPPLSCMTQVITSMEEAQRREGLEAPHGMASQGRHLQAISHNMNVVHMKLWSSFPRHQQYGWSQTAQSMLLVFTFKEASRCRTLI